MNNLFLLISFALIIALVVGLIKPTSFSRFIKGEITRKKISLIFGIAIVVFFIMAAVTTDNNSMKQASEKNSMSQPVVAGQREQSQLKFGFTKEQRQQIYKELVLAETRADNEAETQYPTSLSDTDAKTATANIGQYTELFRNLSDKYTQQVLDKYNISEKIASQISGEAIVYHWPQS